MAKEKEGTCGHVNKHSIGLDGKNDNIACVKESGHDGNHGAEHEEYVESHDSSAIQVGKKRYVKKKIYREWSDMAGTSVKDIKVQVLQKTPEELAQIELAKMAVGGNVPDGTKFG